MRRSGCGRSCCCWRCALPAASSWAANTPNNTLALEMIPKGRRGFVGGLLQGAYPLGFAAVSLVTTIMLTVTTKEQYFYWGWRIPFVLGFVLAFVFLFYYRVVPESAMWQETEK